MDRDALEAKYGSHHDDFNSGGYEWCVNNWGTKWNAYDIKRRDYGGFCLTFQTAWSPPLPVIAELHKRFPECRITLEFFERGMAFSGGVSYLQSEYAEDDEQGWEPGKPYREWRSDTYCGNRGG